jgi:hypothetical protein
MTVKFSLMAALEQQNLPSSGEEEDYRLHRHLKKLL